MDGQLWTQLHLGKLMAIWIPGLSNIYADSQVAQPVYTIQLRATWSLGSFSMRYRVKTRNFLVPNVST
jgi:hypothetical protein